MKKYLFIIFISLGTLKAYSQKDSTSNIDLLRGPISPASNLLNISSSEIQRPTDVKAFMFSLQNATQNFSSLPSSFAVDLAPFWFGKKGLSLNETLKEDKKIMKSLVISVAARNLQSSKKVDSTSQIGVGFRIALAKGKYKNTEVLKINKAYLDYTEVLDKIKSEENLVKIKTQLDSIATLVKNKTITDPIKVEKAKAEIERLDNILMKNYSGWLTVEKDSIEKKKTESIDEFRKLKSIKIARVGFKADLAGGIAWDYKDSKYINGKILNGGVWLTAGHEGIMGHTVLGIVRYLHTPDKLYKDLEGLLNSKKANSMDGGLRYNYQMPNSPLNLSSEVIYRKLLSKGFEDSFKWVLNTGYDLGQNTILSLSLGRDFDKSFKSDGNIIAMLNFVKGFGSK